MNITIIGPSKKFLSGISYYTIKLANALSKEHKVSVITIKNLLPKFLFPGKNRVGKQLSNLDLDKNIQVCWCLDYYIFPGIFKAINFLKQQNPDAIIMQWWSSSAAFNYLLLKIINKLFLNKKIIIEFHETLDPLENNIWLLRGYVSFISKILFNDLDAYIVHSNYDRDLVQKVYSLKKEKVFVIPHGPYDNYIKKTKIKKNKGIFNILFFGLIRNYKGLEYLIEGFNKIPQELINNFRLNIVGEIWDNKEKVYSMIESSKYRSKIKLINKYVPDEDVNNYFTLADVVVLPYTRTSQSGVVQIAVSYGKPIIITNISSLIETLKNYNGVFFVDQKNSEQIKNKIIKIFNLKNRKFRNTEFSWNTTIYEYQRLFKKI
jgi:glycosyltransferase involved in cell wall biosynthesis